MAPGGSPCTARWKTSKIVVVATEHKWCLVAQNGAPGNLLGFHPTALWQRQADTIAAGNFVCDVRLDGLSP